MGREWRNHASVSTAPCCQVSAISYFTPEQDSVCFTGTLNRGFFKATESRRRISGGRMDSMNRRKFLTAGISTIALTRMVKAIETKGLQTQNAKLIGGASKIADRDSSQGYLVSLTQAGHGVSFAGLPAGNRLAIRYSSLSVGTISVAVNDKPACKVNIHSSGALTSSYLDAIVDLAIPANANVTISLAPNDVGVNIDRIVVGDELGLPPDIWNLPALPVAAGPYSADWKALGRAYAAPSWWRDAKFGAWSHWDPQSMPEQGDWYARGMYMRGQPAI